MLPFDTLLAARDAVRSKAVSAVDLTRAALDRIQQHDGRLRAFNSVDADRALQRASAVDNGQIAGDLAGVEPMAHALPLANVLRDDVVEPPLPIEQVLQNAPDTDGRFFKVPKVIGGDEDSAG